MHEMEIKVNESVKLHQAVSRSDSSVHIYRLLEIWSLSSSPSLCYLLNNRYWSLHWDLHWLITPPREAATMEGEKTTGSVTQ